MKTLTAITLAACLLASTAHANIAEYCSTPHLRHNAPTQAQYAVINAVLKAASDNGRFYDRSSPDLTTLVVQGSKDFVLPLFTCDLAVDRAMQTIASQQLPILLLELNLAIEAVEAGITSANY